MKNKVSLSKAIKKALYVKYVELIEIPVTGARVTLLRTKQMPEFAFVMWERERTTALSKMKFQFESDVKIGDLYSIVCACCPTKTGLTYPENSTETEEAWNKRMAENFKIVLVDSCRKHTINTLFMRKAHSWRSHYGLVDDIKIIEAKQHKEAYIEEYGRKVIKESLKFLDTSSEYL